MSQLGKDRRCTSQPNDEDRLSALTDDIILCILGRVDITTATRTSVLSKRWTNLPRLLPVLNLRVWDFLPTPFPEPVEAHHMEQATSCLTQATRSLLANPSRKSAKVARLWLQIYVSGNYSREIGPLVCDAIDSVVVKQLDLGILSEKDPRDCKHEDMLQQARDVIGFFTTYPCVHSCLIRLALHNVQFAEQDIHHLLFNSCKQLKQLILVHCDIGDCSVWQINAPNSKLRLFEVFATCLERIEVLCLPKLRRLRLGSWLYFELPLRFGFVPSLKELTLRDGTFDHQDFSLSVVLQGATNLHTLTLDFKGKRLWIQPEGTQLCSGFSKLRKLSICGIFVDFDLLWTINFLEAAPSVEILSVQIWDHACGELRTTTAYGDERTKPQWSIPKFTSSKPWQLKELEILCFRPLEQQFLFVRSVMERAANLKAVLLKEDGEQCEDCEAMSRPHPPPRGGFFPRDKDEQETVLKQLRDGVRSFARIIFQTVVIVECESS